MYWLLKCAISVSGTSFMEPETEIRRISILYVNIQVTKEGATAEKKAVLIKGVTELLVKVLDKNPTTTVVVIDEVDMDNWGIGGKTVTQRRKRL